MKLYLKKNYFIVLFCFTIIAVVIQFNAFRSTEPISTTNIDSLSEEEVLNLKHDYIKPITKYIKKAIQANDSCRIQYLINCLETKSKTDDNYEGLGKVNALRCYLSLTNNKFDSTILYGNRALAIYKANNDTFDYINIHHNMATAFYISNRLDSAEYHYFRGLYYAMHKNDSMYIQQFAANLGTMAFNKSYFNLATQYFEKALNAYNVNSKNKTIILINLVSVSMSKGDDAQAQKLWNENEQLFESEENNYIKSLILVNHMSLLQNRNQWDLSRTLINNLNFDELNDDFKCGCFVTICHQLYHDYGLKSIDTFIVNHQLFYEKNFPNLIRSFNVSSIFNFIKAPVFNSNYFKALYNTHKQVIDNSTYKKFCYVKLLSLIEQKEKKFEEANASFNKATVLYEKYKNIDDSLRYIDLNQLLKLEQLKYENELLSSKYNTKVRQQQYSIALYILLFVLGISVFFIIYFKNKKNRMALILAKLQLKQKEAHEQHIEKEKQLNNRIIELSKSIIIKTNDITEMMKTMQVDNPKEVYNLKRELEKLKQLENIEQPEIAQHIFSNNDMYEKYFPSLKEFNKTERRIFALSVEGYKVKDISSLLNISLQYVHNVRSRLKKKLSLAEDIVWVDLKEMILKNQI